MDVLDQQDLDILAARLVALDKVLGPRVGDYVEFEPGVVRRISYLWPDSVQTSDGGSYYLGDGYVSMSGSLHPGVPRENLVRTKRTRPGNVWFFHHNFPQADGGVQTSIPFRVYVYSTNPASR